MCINICKYNVLKNDKRQCNITFNNFNNNKYHNY